MRRRSVMRVAVPYSGPSNEVNLQGLTLACESDKRFGFATPRQGGSKQLMLHIPLRAG